MERKGSKRRARKTRLKLMVRDSCLPTTNPFGLNMPTFPDGSRVWVTDNQGKPLAEYAKEVEVDEARKRHRRTVCEFIISPSSPARI